MQNTLDDLKKFFKGNSFGQQWIAYDKDISFACSMKEKMQLPLNAEDLKIAR